MMRIDRATYDNLHPSDRLALHFHAVLAAPDEDARQARLDRLDAWVAGLEPRFPRDDIYPLLTACSGTLLEPMRLGPDAVELAVRFVQIALSEQVGGSRARIVSEDTLGISGGLAFRKDLKTGYVERRRGQGTSPGARGDWYFAPARLRETATVEQARRVPLQVSVRPSAEYGFVLAVSVLDRASLGWDVERSGPSRGAFAPVSLPELTRDLEKHSTLGASTLTFGSLLTGLPGTEADRPATTLVWAPTGPEAIVRFSALLAGGHRLTLDPGSHYPRRATAEAVLALPDEVPVDLAVRLRQALPRLTQGLWAELGGHVAPLPWDTLPGANADAA